MTSSSATLSKSAPMPREAIEQTVGTLTSAFIGDPVIRWMYPQAAAYLASFPRFLEAFGGRAFAAGTVYSDPQNRAAAMWLAPGTAPDDEAIETCLLETVAQSQHADMFAVFADMERAHPEFPHWYLPWFGTDANWQSKGIGAELMRRCLAMVDAERLPAYLETPNPRNISFYERHGFRVTGSSQHGKCPPVTFMLREAR
ncbi:GNAT family N-acetyltransferase [Erythrobacter ani]|uniref:GNAT family N-acetyltransferase n=1 Tax=Erythrobacter ani TaxID=2827235 RepID=A0ABS6SNW4_9SPHN|nr:GNAT family N-acetyltransferase [Erythrobacter ani]MBV7266123.1 GNAT family N-acetyltransferase [Erythrobacter ani]